MAAAGSGERLGAGGPKAFVELGGKPMLAWSLEALQAADSVGEVVVAGPPGEESRVSELGVVAVAGGEHRSQSVANALGLASGEIVVVHDAARPLVTPGLIDAVVEELAAEEGAAGVIAAAPISDTVKRADPDGRVEETLDRTGLWAVQTPQAFRADALREALSDDESIAGATDDAMLVEAKGGRVLIHSSPPENLKVTTPFDLRAAELLLRERP
ncbi:MAG: 2-C-methyl-D-erythritol 4-phosphate cytidylyltransferase [Solirubrobacterales bacterium]